MAVEVNGTLRQNLIVLNALGLNSCASAVQLALAKFCQERRCLYDNIEEGEVVDQIADQAYQNIRYQILHGTSSYHNKIWQQKEDCKIRDSQQLIYTHTHTHCTWSLYFLQIGSSPYSASFSFGVDCLCWIFLKRIKHHTM